VVCIRVLGATCVQHAGWILIFTQPRGYQGLVALYALPPSRRDIFSWKFNSHSEKRKRDGMRLGARNRSAQSITYSARGRGYASTTSRYQWTRPRVFLERSTRCPSFSLEAAVEPQGRLILMRFQKIDFANANERTPVRSLSLSLASPLSSSPRDWSEQRVAIEIQYYGIYMYRYSVRR